MRPVQTKRRDLLKSLAAATLLDASTLKLSRAQGAARQLSGIEIMRRPDHVVARLGSRQIVPLQFASGEWTCPGVRVIAEPARDGLSVRLTADRGELTYLQLRWNGKQSRQALVCGNDVLLSYGNLQWRGTVPQRVSRRYSTALTGMVKSWRSWDTGSCLPAPC